MVNNDLKSKLQNLQVSLGAWLTLGHPAIAEIFANAGFDWIVVDLEHSTISLEQAGELIRVIDLLNVAPLVRLTSNDSNQIKRVMDAGAHGIIVPMVNSAEDASKAVAATRNAPDGIRGVGLARAQGYGPRFGEYLGWQKAGPVVIVQIEHIDAVTDLKNILAVQGVDGLIIGPYDLSCSMGIPGEFDRPEFQNIVNEILAIGSSLNCPAGIHIVEPDEVRLREVITDGYKFIAYSLDTRIIDTLARAGIKAFKEIT